MRHLPLPRASPAFPCEPTASVAKTVPFHRPPSVELVKNLLICGAVIGIIVAALIPRPRIFLPVIGCIVLSVRLCPVSPLPSWLRQRLLPCASAAFAAKAAPLPCVFEKVQDMFITPTVPATCLPHTGFAGVWTPATHARFSSDTGPYINPVCSGSRHHRLPVLLGRDDFVHLDHLHPDLRWTRRRLRRAHRPLLQGRNVRTLAPSQHFSLSPTFRCVSTALTFRCLSLRFHRAVCFLDFLLMPCRWRSIDERDHGMRVFATAVAPPSSASQARSPASARPSLTRSVSHGLQLQFLLIIPTAAN